MKLDKMKQVVRELVGRTHLDSRLENCVEALHREFPKVKLRFKDESAFFKVIYYVGFMFLWNPKFLTNYATVLGYTMWFPRREFAEDGLYGLLRHEMQHLRDGSAKWYAYILYTFPQSLVSIVLLLAMLHHWAWLALVPVTLAPWPAPWRSWLEMRGYAETMRAVAAWHGTAPSVVWIEDIIDMYFTSWAYYKMTWKPNRVRGYLQAQRRIIVPK